MNGRSGRGVGHSRPGLVSFVQLNSFVDIDADSQNHPAQRGGQFR